MAAFDDAARLARMTAWVEKIADEVGNALQQHYIFWQVQDMIRLNPQLQNARSHFFQWMGEVFIASAAVAVRRQVDPDKDSICLRRLIQEVKDYATIVTREHYLSLCNPSGSAEEWLLEMNEHTFDQWGGAGRPHVDPAMADADLNLLLTTCDKLQHYATKRVAHYDKNGVKPGKVPTFQDLEDAYKLIEQLTQKYCLMFTATWMGQVRPNII